MYRPVMVYQATRDVVIGGVAYAKGAFVPADSKLKALRSVLPAKRIVVPVPLTYGPVGTQGRKSQPFYQSPRGVPATTKAVVVEATRQGGSKRFDCTVTPTAWTGTSAKFDFGDGTTLEINGPGPYTNTHTYADNVAYTVNAVVVNSTTRQYGTGSAPADLSAGLLTAQTQEASEEKAAPKAAPTARKSRKKPNASAGDDKPADDS